MLYIVHAPPALLYASTNPIVALCPTLEGALAQARACATLYGPTFVSRGVERWRVSLDWRARFVIERVKAGGLTPRQATCLDKSSSSDLP